MDNKCVKFVLIFVFFWFLVSCLYPLFQKEYKIMLIGSEPIKISTNNKGLFKVNWSYYYWSILCQTQGIYCGQSSLITFFALTILVCARNLPNAFYCSWCHGQRGQEWPWCPSYVRVSPCSTQRRRRRPWCPSSGTGGTGPGLLCPLLLTRSRLSRCLAMLRPAPAVAAVWAPESGTCSMSEMAAADNYMRW